MTGTVLDTTIHFMKTGSFTKVSLYFLELNLLNYNKFLTLYTEKTNVDTG